MTEECMRVRITVRKLSNHLFGSVDTAQRSVDSARHSEDMVHTPAVQKATRKSRPGLSHN